jgi:hypothetical protein
LAKKKKKVTALGKKQLAIGQEEMNMEVRPTWRRGV